MKSIKLIHNVDYFLVEFDNLSSIWCSSLKIALAPLQNSIIPDPLVEKVSNDDILYPDVPVIINGNDYIEVVDEDNNEIFDQTSESEEYEFSIFLCFY